MSKDSLYVWALRTHWTKRRRYREMFAGERYGRARVIRIRSARDLENLFRMLEHGVSAKQQAAGG
jgi:hypothetical protein